MNKFQRIVAIIRREYELAIEQHRKASVEHAAMIASANAWSNYHTDDGIGSFSANPYTQMITNKSNIQETARIHVLNMKEAYECAVDTFLTKLDKS